MSGILEKLISALEANTAAAERNADLVAKIVAAGEGKMASGDKPSGRGRKPKETKGDEDAGSSDDDTPVDADDLAGTLDKVKGWLKEFSEAGEDDPENAARSEKLAKALSTLGIDKVSNVKKESDRLRIEEWIDKRIAAGRITEEPKKKAAPKKEEDDI